LIVVFTAATFLFRHARMLKSATPIFMSPDSQTGALF
jgi:hypothetical protein